MLHLCQSHAPQYHFLHLSFIYILKCLKQSTGFVDVLYGLAGSCLISHAVSQMCSQLSTRNQVTGVRLSTMNSTIVWARLTTPHRPACLWTASLTHRTIRTASALDSSRTSTATRQSKTPADTSEKVWSRTTGHARSVFLGGLF